MTDRPRPTSAEPLSPAAPAPVEDPAAGRRHRPARWAAVVRAAHRAGVPF